MKKTILLALGALFCLGVFGTIFCFRARAQQNNQPQDWANLGRYAQANGQAPQGATAVFMGNSITDAWPRTSPEFFTANNYIGRGIGGQVTAQMLVRFRPDVVALHPECVVILAGTNDIAQNQGPVPLEHILDNIASMCEIARQNGIKVVLCSVLPAEDYGWRPGLEPAQKIVALNKMLKQYADSQGIVYVDYHVAMRNGKDGLRDDYGQDGVHPNPKGYAVMQSLIKPAIDSVVR